MVIKCPKCNADNPDTLKFCGECGTQLPSLEKIEVTETLETPREELTTGSTFACRYQIIEELGRGGMARVYKATDTKINEKVALKLIKPEIASDKKTLERFGNELKIARKIVHKNVGRMYDINEEKGTHYITMEYVSGQDLKGFIRQSGQMGVGTAISIIKQICDGLSEAHKTGVTHRDLKPSNIMIDREGNVRIMDFGIARSLKEKGITGAGVMIGTPEYMSPEQAEAKEVDQRSDIYSLGVILYEMVTGRVPFEGDTALSIAMKHKSEVPKNPKDYNAQIPDDLNKLILKCLEKDKNSRYQSAGELYSELNNIEKGIPTTDRVIPKRTPITSKEVTVTFGLKKLYIPALIILFLAVVFVIFWQMLSRESMSIAVIPFSFEGRQQDRAYLGSGVADDITTRLFKLKKWKVVNSPSALLYQESGKSPKEIGQELNVTHILIGTIREERDTLRITTRLIKVKDNSIAWSDTYEEELQSIFGIQRSIAEDVASAIRKELSPEEKLLIETKTTENLRAYELYTQGRLHWNRRTIDDFMIAIELYKKAIELDPDYALAYAGIAESYVLLEDYTVSLNPSQDYPRKAREAAARALELDDSLVEVHGVLGYLKLLDGDFKGAEKELKKAAELNPSYATAHQWYAELLLYQARFDEALDEILLARDLDPNSKIITFVAARIYRYRGEYDLAIETYLTVRKMDPSWDFLCDELGMAYLYNSMYEEALAEFDKAAAFNVKRGLSTETVREVFKTILNNEEALKLFKQLLETEESVGESLEEFKNKLEYLTFDYDVFPPEAEEIIKRIANLFKSSYYAYYYAKIGNNEELKKMLKKMEEFRNTIFSEPENYGYHASMQILLGNYDLGLAYLERAVENNERMFNIKVDPLFDEVRSDPRYQSLLKKIGLD